MSEEKPRLGVFKQPPKQQESKWGGDTRPIWIRMPTPEELAERQRRNEQRDLARALSDAGVTAEAQRSWEATDMLYTRPVSEVFRSFVSPTERLLTLSGDPGCGKTYAALCAVRLRIKDPPRHFRALREGTKPPVVIEQAMLYRAEPWAAEPWDAWRDASLLVLEDLGTETLDPAGHMLAKIDRLVNERYADNRRLIITTNLRLAAFGARYGSRVVSRLTQTGLGRFVELPSGTSLRG